MPILLLGAIISPRLHILITASCFIKEPTNRRESIDEPEFFVMIY